MQEERKRNIIARVFKLRGWRRRDWHEPVTVAVKQYREIERGEEKEKEKVREGENVRDTKTELQSERYKE